MLDLWIGCLGWNTGRTHVHIRNQSTVRHKEDEVHQTAIWVRVHNEDQWDLISADSTHAVHVMLSHYMPVNIVALVLSPVRLVLAVCQLCLAIWNLLSCYLLFTTSLWHHQFVSIFCAGGCKVVKSAEDSLLMTASLLGVDKEELRDSLISRVMQATRGGTKGTAIKYTLFHLIYVL